MFIKQKNKWNKNYWIRTKKTKFVLKHIVYLKNKELLGKSF